MGWTHRICENCWNIKNPDREPVKVKDGEKEICCFCSEETASGIYVRHNPQELKCNCD